MNVPTTPVQTPPRGEYKEHLLDLVEAYDCVIVKWTRPTRGYAYHLKYTNGVRCIGVPHPRGTYEWLVAAHEVGHHLEGHSLHPTRLNRVTEEWQAWEAARRLAVEFGVEIDPASDQQIRRQISWAVHRALVRGLKRPPEGIIQAVTVSYADSLRGLGWS